MPEKRPPVPRAIPVSLRFVLASPLGFGVFEAWRRAWVCDDIYVSFRYIDHLAHGFGLVFNPGERVEGYTHFLWVMLLAALHSLGFDLVTLGRYLPIVAWSVLLAVLFVHALRAPELQPARSAWLGLPIAAWGVALHRDAQLFASSGLETAFFALLLLAGLLGVAGRKPRLEFAAVFYALAMLVRPEGMLYTATAIAFVLWRWRDLRRAARFAAVWAALVGPFLVWKLVYYGSILPNTYYAKSAGQAYWSQGWTYTRMYFVVYPVLVVCLLVAVAGLMAGTRWRARAASPQPAIPNGPISTGPRRDARQVSRDLVLLALVQVLLTVAYVTRVGGDFMFARFFVPVTPLAYLAAEEAVRSTRRPVLVAALAVVVVGLTLAARFTRQSLLLPCEQVHGIVDEPSCYTRDSIRDMQHQGEVLGRMLAGTAARIALPPGRTMVAYYGHLPYAVEGSGLTDAEIAHMPIERRGRPGHEKGPSDDYLHRHQVQFRLLYGLHRTTHLRPYERIGFDDVVGQIVFYDPPVMEALKQRRGVAFLDFPLWLDDYLRGPLAELPTPRLLDDYARFQRFYFQHHPDPERLARLRAALRDAGVPASSL